MTRILKFLMMWVAVSGFTHIYAQGGDIATCSAGDSNWEPTEHRSAQGFTITLQGDVLNAYSNKAYDNVAIQITDADGVSYYTKETPMTPDTPVVIPIEALPAGEYQIYFYTGYELITMHFVKSINN